MISPLPQEPTDRHGSGLQAIIGAQSPDETLLADHLRNNLSTWNDERRQYLLHDAITLVQKAVLGNLVKTRESLDTLHGELEELELPGEERNEPRTLALIEDTTADIARLEDLALELRILDEKWANQTTLVESRQFEAVLSATIVDRKAMLQQSYTPNI